MVSVTVRQWTSTRLVCVSFTTPAYSMQHETNHVILHGGSGVLESAKHACKLVALHSSTSLTITCVVCCLT
jgi:hypothetical protein